MNSRRKFSFAFRIATIVCCLIGVLSNILRTTSIQSMLSFYTMQSNLFVLFFYLGSLVIILFRPNWEKTELYHFLKGATTMIILLTFVVYIASLHPATFAMDVKTATSNIFRISNLFVHFITPIMVVLDYFICDEKGYFKLCYPLFWQIFPLLYLVYVYTYSSMGGVFFSVGGSRKYAYFFLDIDKLGVFGVFKYILILSLFFMLMCYILIFLDNLLAKRKENN